MDKTPTPTRICLVSHNGYGAMVGGRSGHIGGVEYQTSLTALWLASRGHAVSFVTWDEGQADGTEIDGVRLLAVCRQDAGLPGLRFLHPRWTSLNRALARADADVYYQNCGEYVTGQVALWCRRRGRGFVYSVASDPDCDPNLPEMRYRRERVLYRYGLRHADRVITQTNKQQRMLREGFGVDAVVVPMPCPGPKDAEFVRAAPPHDGKGRVLWVGRVLRIKRPDRLLEMAAGCPDLEFDLVGPGDGSEYATEVLQRAEAAPNVTVHGPIAHDALPALYRRASCLCCTSDFEGFPNTFLEAWSHGLPVVSTVDPDNLISSRGLGATAGDVPDLVRAVLGLFGDESTWRGASEQARRYYAENHAVDAVLPCFEQALVDAARRE